MAGMYQNTLLEEQKKKIPYTGPMMAPGAGVLAPNLPVTSELNQEPVVEQIPEQVPPVAAPVQPVVPQQQVPAAIPQMPGMREEMAGLNLQQKAIQEKSAADNAVISDISARQMADAKDIEEKRSAFEREQSDKLASYNKELEALNNTPIKSPDWWGSKTTGEKIMAGVGLFFAALGNKGQMTQALASIDNQIENDIKLQEKNLESKKEGVKGKIGILDKMRSIYGDIESSKLASKKAIYDGLAKQLEINANNANSKMAKAAFMQGVARAKQESQKYSDSLMQKQQELALKNMELQAKKAKEGIELTPAQKKAEEKFGENYNEYVEKMPSLRNKIETLKQSVTELNKGGYSGPIEGRLGGILNPKGAIMQDRIKALALETATDLLKGTMSDRDIQNLVEKSYNPLLPEKENSKKLLDMIEMFESSYRNRADKIKKFEETGSTISNRVAKDDSKQARLRELEEKMRAK